VSRLIPLVAFFLVVPVALGQQSSAPKTISDNSFLIEEAYNQEAGVVQHINTFTRGRDGNWTYTFTQEWPIGSMKHQLSFTITALRNDNEKGIGDTAINYRYQLVNKDRVAVAPRISVLLPTGSSKNGLGFGEVGLQTNLPISITHSSKFVTHWNAGATLIPRAKNELSQKAFSKGFNLGQSTIWLATNRFNVLVETVWNSFELVLRQHQTEKQYSAIVNPGIRWAHNFPSGLQIVPGVSFPIGFGPSNGNRGVFFYLSFEHPFKKE
jgi:outer membrane putative beta-barrel porin/alpha-amylase